MKRKTLAAIVLTGIAALLSAQPEIITITGARAFGPLSRPPVAFPYRAHTLIEGVSCAACHAGKKAIRDSYHRLCIGCHGQAKSRGGATGPRVCGDCHAWRK